METKDLIMYGAIVYLFLMLRKKQSCNCAAMVPVLPLNNPTLVDFAPRDRSVPIIPIIPIKDCVNCDLTMGLNNIISLPKFTTVNNQVQPTPAEILSPEQLAVFNVASIKGIANKYIC
jgi:hypothetical protein